MKNEIMLPVPELKQALNGLNKIIGRKSTLPVLGCVRASRKAIWHIQISKYGRHPNEFDIVQLARMTEQLTGSEIEGVFVEALFQAFDAGQEPTDLTIAGVLNDFVPLSKTMAEQISGLRNWAKGRARLATAQVQEKSLRKMAV